MHLKEPEHKTELKMGSRGKGSSLSHGKDNITLFMECVDEELSEAQQKSFNKAKQHYKETNDNIQNMLRSGLIDITEKKKDYITFEVKEKVKIVNENKTPTTTGLSRPIVPAPPQASPQIVLQNAGMPGTNGNTYQLVMDPRTLGLIVSSAGTPQVPSSTVPVVQQPTPTLPVAIPAPALSNPVVRPPQNAVVGQTAVRNVMRTPISHVRPQIKTITPRASIPVTVSTVNTPVGSTPSGRSPAVRIRPTKQLKATEANSVGGIVQNKTAAPPKKSATTATTTTTAVVVDLTNDETKAPPTSDTKEVMFNKLSGKTYPSLVVVARPNLKVKDFTPAQISTERATLDAKLKAVLMGSPTKFTEWLIQQGLVRSEQYCSVHVNADLTPIKLKLGMYSDISKFPYSGGYVWISECCPTRFVSVFSGSIFEGAPHAPTVLVKLMYHWACQTGVSNISTWVKVEGLYVKNFYTNIRSVCTSAVHEKIEKLGGPRKRVELGVISLGTTSQDGNMRQVKVEVLGVYDPESKMVRLRAVEPLQDGERNFRRRFVKILEPLEEWVHKESIILTDFTVDKNTLHQLGYKTVYQVSLNEQQASQSAKYSNNAIMDYLRRIIPRMFQNTLSLLSRQIIQQFLDELVWREKWGTIPARAFESLIAHLAEQTKLDSGDTLMTRLNKIATNPFKSWAYKNWQTNCSTGVLLQPSSRIVVGSNIPVQIQQPGPTLEPSLPTIDNLPASLRTSDVSLPTESTQNQVKRGRKQKASVPFEPEAKKKCVAPVVSANQRPLDSYYYGTINGDQDIINNQRKGDINMKCALCKMVIKDNLKMMRHLIVHAYNEGAYTFSESSPQCRYCLKDFVTEYSLQTHVDETHGKSPLVCLICRDKSKDRTNFILHMHRNHVELELPYQCSICYFRTSQHKDLVDHFYEVHSNTDKLQCPFCLKIVSMHTSDGRKITQNQYFFILHLQKHQRKSVPRKCHKCVLGFVHKDLIKEHFLKFHVSCKDRLDVERYPVDNIDTVMMPTPLDSSVMTYKSTMTKSKQPLISNYTLNNFQSLQIVGVEKESLCCECEGEVIQENHYPGFLSCLKCRFSTCCNKALAEHIDVYHEKPESKHQFNVGKVIMLEKPLHCVCGFSSKSGNKLARHLAECKRKSAYASSERAFQCTLQGQSASFPPLVTLDEDGDNQDNDSKWLRAFAQPRNVDVSDDKSGIPSTSSSRSDPQSMLNVLGLVRKASTDEPHSDSEHSLEMMNDDEK